MYKLSSIISTDKPYYLAYFVLFISININFQTCSSSKNVNNITISLEEILGKGYTSVPNDSNTYLLCYKDLSTDPKMAGEFEYLIADLNSNEIIKHDKIRYGEARWFDNHTVEIKYGKGVIKDISVGKNKFYFDVLTKTIIEENEKKK